MKIIVLRSPKFLAPFLRLIFKIPPAPRQEA